MLRAGHLQALIGLTIVGALLRFVTLGTQSYWYDEAITVDLVRRSLHGLLATIPSSESTPPLYYVLAWGWAKLFGTGEAALRSLSALLGTATVPAAYAAARGFVSARSSLITAAFVAVSPLLVWYSQEARAYALLVLLGTLSLAFFRRALDRGATWLTWWVIASVLAVATHYFAVFLVAAEAGWLLLRSAERRAASKAVGVVALLTLALVPLAVYQAGHYQHTEWIANSGSLVGRAAYFVHQLVVGVYPISSIRPIVAAVPLLVLVGLFAWTERRERRGALLALTLGLITVAAPLATAAVGDVLFGGRGDYFIYRNLVVAAVPLMIPAAAIAGTARAGKFGLAASAVTCLLLVAVSVRVSRQPDLQRPDIRAVAAAIGTGPTARAILLDARTRLALKLYRPDLREMPRQGAELREVDVIEEKDNSNAPQAALSPPAGFRRVETRHVVQGFTIVRLQAPTRRLVTRATLVRQFPSGREVAILVDPPTSYRG